MFSVLWQFLIHVYWVFLVFCSFNILSYFYNLSLSQIARQFSNLANLLFNLSLNFLFQRPYFSFIYICFFFYIFLFFVNGILLWRFSSLFLSHLNNFKLRYFRFSSKFFHHLKKFYTNTFVCCVSFCYLPHGELYLSIV